MANPGYETNRDQIAPQPDESVSVGKEKTPPWLEEFDKKITRALTILSVFREQQGLPRIYNEEDPPLFPIQNKEVLQRLADSHVISQTVLESDYIELESLLLALLYGSEDSPLRSDLLSKIAIERVIERAAQYIKTSTTKTKKQSS